MENSVQSWRILHSKPICKKHLAENKIYLITRSALASTTGGIVRPICFAVFKLITSSNFVGCSTRKIGGLSAFENFMNVSGYAAIAVHKIGFVVHESTGI